MSVYTQEQRWDHQRDLRKHEPSPRHQKDAVQKLVGYVHGILTDGLIASPEIAKALHARVCEVCNEFSIDKPPAPGVRG